MNGVGVISFSTVLQEHAMRKSLQFIAKKKSVLERWSELMELFSFKREFLRKKNQENYVWISLKFISEHYLFTLPLYVKNRMNGREMIELVGDSWDTQNSEGIGLLHLYWEFQHSLKDN